MNNKMRTIRNIVLDQPIKWQIGNAIDTPMNAPNNAAPMYYILISVNPMNMPTIMARITFNQVPNVSEVDEVVVEEDESVLSRRFDIINMRQVHAAPNKKPKNPIVQAKNAYPKNPTRMPKISKKMNVIHLQAVMNLYTVLAEYSAHALQCLTVTAGAHVSVVVSIELIVSSSEEDPLPSQQALITKEQLAVVLQVSPLE